MTTVQDISSGVVGMRDGFLRTGFHLDGEPVTLATARQGYSEGPVMFKRKGIYYYIYTLSGHQNYVNAYMMSRESPLTGFVNAGGERHFFILFS